MGGLINFIFGRPLGRFVCGGCFDDFDDDGNDGRAAFLDDVVFFAGEGDFLEGGPLFLPPPDVLAGVGMMFMFCAMVCVQKNVQCSVL